VRIFEWNGPMVHARQLSPTALDAGRLDEPGLASWLGNWEIDVSIENENRREMEQIFLTDLENATEVVLGDRTGSSSATRRRRSSAWPEEATPGSLAPMPGAYWRRGEGYRRSSPPRPAARRHRAFALAAATAVVSQAVAI
jgi:hypothetical protein